MPKNAFNQLSDQKRDFVYQNCLELFAAYGYARTSMKKITSRLRVADGYLYYYFEGKEDLVRWVIERGVQVWVRHFHENVETRQPRHAFELFRLSILQMARFINEERLLYGAYTQFISEPGFPLKQWLIEKIGWIDQRYRDSIQEDVERGAIRSDMPVNLMVSMMDTVNARIQEFIYTPALDTVGAATMNEQQLSEFVDQLVSIFRDGMAARSSE